MSLLAVVLLALSTGVVAQHALFVQQNDRFCPVAAMVAEKGFDLLDAPIQRVTSMHTPIPFAPKLEKYVTVSEEKIIAAVKKIVG